MKWILLFLVGMTGLMVRHAAAQGKMEFTFLGNEGGNHESVVMTSAKDLKWKNAEILCLDQRRLDSLRNYILRVYREYGGNVPGDVRVTGVGSKLMYFDKDSFSELVFSSIRYFKSSDLITPTVYNALLHLRYLGHEEFFHRHLQDSPVMVDPYLKLKDKPN